MKSTGLVFLGLLIGCSSEQPSNTPVDSGVAETATPVDSAVTDTVAEDADAKLSSCVPSEFHPPHPHEAKCTDADLAELHDACLGSAASTAACNAFRAAKNACYACFLTDANAAAQGALTQWEKTAVRYIDINVGGCLSLLAADSSSTSCGAKWDAWNRCAIAECCASTPFATFQSCVGAARTGACKDLKAAYDACLPTVTNGKMCTPAGHSSARDLYLYAGKLFCGSP